MTNQQLIQFLELLKTDLLNSMQARGIDASGQIGRQFAITIHGSAARLEIPGYMQLLEIGRGPTSANAVPGDPPMIQRIQEWCREKGIPDKAAWAIKKSIDKKGYKGNAGILSIPLGDDNINSRLNVVLPEIASSVIDQIGRSYTNE